MRTRQLLSKEPVRPGRRAARWIVFLVLALGLFACGGRSGAPLEPECTEDAPCACRRSSDCPLGLSCLDGFCRAPTSVAGDLPFAALCKDDRACGSGLCLPAGDGSFRRCSLTCEGEDCPAGWRCAADEGGGGRCVEDVFRLCLECAADTDCGPSGASFCVRVAGEATGECRLDCGLDPCPSGYACEDVESGGRRRAQCVPTTGSCASCAPGFARACSVTTELGTCLGREVCAGGAFGACDARAPRPEACNGVDDDCDGRVDVEDPGLVALDVPGFPACALGEAPNCAGTWTCTVAAGGSAPDWACLPAERLDETCNGLDDDCDGTVDEDFRGPDDRYLDVEHCGACNRDCRALLPELATDATGEVVEGAVACELRGGEPTCVPRLCAPGFAPGPEDAPIACETVPGVQCLECGRDADCVWSANRCAVLGDDPAGGCLQGCGPGAPYPGCTGEEGAQGCCPAGSLCERREGALVCLPAAGTCGCFSGREGAERPCLRPGGGGAECSGVQFCERVGDAFRWSACTSGDVTREVCNGADDDCDGAVDEDFSNTQGSGTYDTDAHCGRCYESCLVLPQAEGRCDPEAGPRCAISRCLEGQVVGGGLCRVDADCAAGFSCDPAAFQCVRSCISDAQCPGGACAGGRCGTSCGSDAACRQAFGEASTCSGGVCAISYDYADLDEEVANGCECPALSADDPPDIYESYPAAGLPALDRNCDGVDGVAARALFVRAGASGGDGRRISPFGSIGDAIARFDPARHDHVLVATGTYRESVSLRPGIEIYGGYAPGFSRRDVAGLQTVIAGRPGRPAVRAESLGGGRTVLAGFVVQGSDAIARAGAGQDGAAAVAVEVEASPGLVLANLVIRAGAGADGGSGRAEAGGASGEDGGAGRDAAECSSTSCAGEAQPGGAGGRNAACVSAAGNPGGRASGDQNPQQYTGNVGKDGRGGSNALYTNAGDPSFSNLCKYDCQVPGDLEGDDARPGDSGEPGRGGRGCRDPRGRSTGAGWQPRDAARAGGAGDDGTGGGGGGAGGGVRNANGPGCTVGRRVGDLGATGGGGGAGGCRGRGGLGGGHGGASIAVLVLSGGAPTFEGTEIVPGAGGAGGAGGDGGRGGLGGQGGLGGVSMPPAWCGGSAGRGGRGGRGGAGGGGGGGCGGPSYGVAGPGLGASISGVRFRGAGRGGGGGAGGRSPAGASGEGARGADAPSAEVSGL